MPIHEPIIAASDRTMTMSQARATSSPLNKPLEGGMETVAKSRSHVHHGSIQTLPTEHGHGAGHTEVIHVLVPEEGRDTRQATPIPVH